MVNHTTRAALIALRDLRKQLVDAAPAESRADVRRLLGEAEHNVSCALAAAGLHPLARTVEEPRAHGGTLAQGNADGQVTP